MPAPLSLDMRLRVLQKRAEGKTMGITYLLTHGVCIQEQDT